VRAAAVARSGPPQLVIMSSDGRLELALFGATTTAVGATARAASATEQPRITGRFTLEEEEPAQEEQLCPRGFWITRMAAKILARTWAAPFLVASGFVAGGSELLAMLVGEGLPKGTQVGAIHAACDAGAISFLALVLPGLRHILATDGPLHMLGAGTRMIHRPPRAPSMNPIMRRLVLMARGGGLDLPGWALLITAISIIVLLAAGLGWAHRSMEILFCVEDSRDNYHNIPYAVGSVFFYCLTIPLALCWWLTLKVASALVKHRVATLRKTLERVDIDSPEWDETVAVETRVLINDTFSTLSTGWAPGVTVICLTCWVQSLNQLAMGMGGTYEGEQHPPSVGTIVATMFMAMGPTVLLWDVADASSECDLLVKSLNEKRVADPSDAAHIKIYKLEVMISNLNKKQGLGFVVFGVVLDKAYFFSFMFKLGGVGVTVMTAILALGTAPASGEHGTDVCSLSASQVATIQGVMMGSETCSYNVTLTEILSM
jgi:hypothetical protein